MRKLFFVIMITAAAASAAHAEPSGKCGGGAFAVSSSPGVVICSNNSVYKGSVEARSTGGTGLYVVADGDSTNQSLPTNCFDGYVAVQTGGGYSGVTFASNGDYAYGPQPHPDPATYLPCK